MADADVRAARPADAEEIARIQLVTWRTAYAAILPEDVLAGLDAGATADQWRATIARGPATVFVATEGEWTVGFGAAGPAPAPESASADGSPPPDAATVALIATLLVEPRWGRRGHGGRLLAAAADAMRAAGSTRGICWVPEADTASLAFYRRAGWAPDGTVRTLDAGGQALREVRLTGTLDIALV
ncbi:MAG TPA: GNAT family N-acetyltransferase [Actinophytocola sp.]|uniref:GNAT family N-acetyltransferase n=1 Tax=Actinophytocola sp. TaxID=1872138 RepID=UPI002DDD39E3|nr:GNAT family N-acetyltransferase [Actinophytocola sp.]HEV2784192.1 GNAT family N-acetyltransferase [Actinophytocola sp.]